MEKENTRNTYELQDDANNGTVRIADDVVGMIAGIAATEVEGVSAMGGNITNELMNLVGVKSLTKGVKVEVTGRKVTVDLAITMDYGYSIPSTCQMVQNRVKTTIESMTGLEVTDVNIRIAAIKVNKDKE